MPTCVIIGALVVSCTIDPTTKPTAVDAARVLEQAPGLSNRTNWRPVIQELRGPRVLVVPSSIAPTAKPVEQESEQARANRLGVPGGFTVLEWAILNGGR